MYMYIVQMLYVINTIHQNKLEYIGVAISESLCVKSIIIMTKAGLVTMNQKAIFYIEIYELCPVYGTEVVILAKQILESVKNIYQHCETVWKKLTLNRKNMSHTCRCVHVA